MSAQPLPRDACRSRLAAYLLLTVTAFCWAGNAIAGKAAVGEISPMLLVALRWGLATALVMILAGGQFRRDWPVMRPRLGLLAAMGALGFTAFNGLFYVAAHYTSALNIGILQGAMPILVLLGAYLWQRSPVGLLQGIGVVITMAGVVTVVSAGTPARFLALAFNFGDLLMLGACVLYSGYTVLLREKPLVAPLSLMGVLSGVAFLAAIPLAVVEALMGQAQMPSAKGWLILAFVAIFPSLVAQTFWMRGVAIIGPGRAGVFINLVPVFASGLAVLLLAERLQGYHLVALGLVLGGIWLAERKS